MKHIHIQLLKMKHFIIPVEAILIKYNWAFLCTVALSTLRGHLAYLNFFAKKLGHSIVNNQRASYGLYHLRFFS